jgi:hypothetical protein
LASTFLRKTERSIGTDSTIIDSYTVPANTIATVIGLSVSNILESQVEIEALIDDGSANTHLIKNAPIPRGGSLVIVGGDQKVVLVSGDSVRVQSSESSSVDVVLSLLEID